MGHFTRDAGSRTSMENMLRRMRTAQSGVADLRCNSLMELICSSDPAGMKPVEKISRYEGSSRPQPTSTSFSRAWSSSTCLGERSRFIQPRA